VFTYLLEGLGAKDVQFEELLSLEGQELKAFRYRFPFSYMLYGQTLLE
jgi:hypothetical protein